MASNNNGRVEFDMRLNNAQLRADAAAAVAAIRNVGDSTVAEGAKIDNAFKNIGGTIATVFTLQSAAAFAKEIVRVRGEVESLEISFETLLGNKSKAAALISEIKTFASTTPMQLGDLAKGAQTLLGFNVEAEKVMPILRQIGDISMGNAEKFNSLILSFSQMSSTGKLMGQDLLQMINAGFNPLVTLADMTGKSISELKDEMSAGAISAEMVANAFASAAGEGGKFYGMLDKQSQGIAGSLSNLQGAIEDMFNEMGTESQGVITGVISGATAIVENYKAVGEALAVVISMYGAYKAAVMTSSALTAAVEASNRAATVAGMNAEMAALSKLLPVKKAVVDADIAAAITSGRLTEAKGAELLALRLEVQAKVESLTVSKSKAAAELHEARTAHIASTERMISAKAELAAKQAAFMAARNSMSLQDREAAQAAVLAAKKEVETAAIAKNTTSKQYAAAQSKLLITTNALETTQQGLNTASQIGNTVSTNVLTAAKVRLIAAMKKLTATMLANPYAFVAAAVVAAGYALYKFITHQTEAEKMQAELNKTIREGERSIEAERIEVEILFSRLKNAKKGTEEWDAARKAIMSKYGQYLKSLGDEKTALDDIAKAQNAVTQGVLETARARLMESTAQEAAKTLAEKESETYNEIREAITDRVKDKGKVEDYMIKLRPVIEGKAEITDEIQSAINAGGVNWMGKSIVGKLLDELKEVRETADSTMSDLHAKYGELPVATPDDGKPNVFDAMSASLQKLNAELPKANDALQLLQKAETPDKSAIDAQKEKIKLIEDARKAREKELIVIRDVEDQIKQLRDEQKQFGKDDAEYKDRENRINALQTKLPDKGKTGSPKKTKDEILAELDSLSQDISRRVQDLEYQTEQATIDAMQVGFEKEKQQLELNHRKKITEINRQSEDLLATLRANAKKEWELKGGTGEFDDSKIGLSEEQGKFFDTQRDAANKANAEALQQLNSKLLSEFEDYQTKRARIEQEYTDKIAALEKKSRTGANAEQVDRAIAEAKTRMNSALAEIDDMTVSVTDTVYKLFSDMSEKSLREISAIADEAEKMLEFVLKGEYDENIADGFGLTEAQFNSLMEKLSNPKELDAYKKKIDELRKSVEQFDAPLQRMIKGLKKVLNSGADVKLLREGFDKISEGLSSVTSLGDQFANTLRELGGDSRSLNEIADVLTDVMRVADTTMQGIQTGVIGMITGITTLATSSAAATTAVATTSAAAISSVEKASVILTIISAAIQVVMAIANLLKNIFSKDKKRDREIARLQGQVDALQESYDALGKAIDKAYSADAAKLIKDQDANLRQQKKLIEEQMRLEEEKKKTDDGKVQKYRDALKDIDEELSQTHDKTVEAIIGADIKSAIDDFAEAYIDAWAAGENKAAAMKDVVRKMIKSSVAELVKSRLADETKAFMDKLAEAMKDGVLTIAEENALDALEASMYNALNGLDANFDKYIKDKVEDEREASSKGFESMSQDTANELNGRFTALQALTSEINSSVKSLVTNSAVALKHLAGIESNTESLTRLAVIEGDIHSIKTGINDKNLKGLILRKQG
jgi:tape measure domain-containing protein